MSSVHYCDYCHQSYTECNCPSDMTPRKTGQQIFEELLGKKPLDKKRQKDEDG